MILLVTLLLLISCLFFREYSTKAFLFIEKERKIYTTIIVFLFIYSAFRFIGKGYGFDLQSYQTMYIINDTFSLDIFFRILIAKTYLWMPFGFFVILTSVIGLAGPITYIYKKSSDFLISIILFVTTFYSLYNYGVIRQSVAMSIVFLAILLLEKPNKKRNITGFLLLGISIGFHKSVLIVLPIIILSFFINKQFSDAYKFVTYKKILLYIFMLVFLSFIDFRNLANLIINTLSDFGINLNTYAFVENNPLMSIGFYLNISIVIMIAYLYKNDDKYFKKRNLIYIMFVFAIVFDVVFNFYPIVVERGLDFIWFFRIVLVSDIYIALKNKNQRVIYYVLFFGYITFIFFVNLLPSIINGTYM